MKAIRYIDRKTGETRLERPPAERFLRFLYHHPLGRLPLEWVVKRKALTHLYARRMRRSASVKRIRPFVERFGIDMGEARRPVEDFRSFNDFFCRKLKPEARPIAAGLVSPADGRLLAFEDVGQLRRFFIKGQPFSLSEFLQDEELAAYYEGGPLVIVRLAPNDYHRFHFPYAGRPSEPHRIGRGHYYSVSPYALAYNFTKVFCGNRREYSLLETPDKGNILIAPVGATMVGSIFETYTPGEWVDKGAEMGYFAFGGSTILLALPPNRFVLDEDLLGNSRNRMETLVQMGERIGV